MAHMDKNRQIADTQEISDSQCTISQQFFTCEEFLDVWGQLKDAVGEIYQLRAMKTYFGRDHFPTNDPNIKSYVFDPRKMKRLIYERLSKCHFVIERDIPLDPKKACFEPAILTCKGRNGLVVCKHKLEVGDKRILKDGDWISLPSSTPMKIFQFNYSKSGENFIERSCEIHDSFYIGGILGKGACGEVRKVIKVLPIKKKNATIFEEYAIKCLEKPKDSLSISKDEACKALLNEVKIMRTVNHIHVMRLFDVFESSHQVVLVFPFMKGGDLLTRILNQPKKCMNEQDSKFFFAQLNLGLKYLHSKLVTHRDIKPENILLSDRSDSPILSIGDFGLSKMNDVMKTQCGTEYYVAPEILIKKNTLYTAAVDVWSSGVVLYAMLTGKMPFTNGEGETMRDRIIAGKFEFLPKDLWIKIPTAKDIVRSMLQVNVEHRITPQQIENHQWLMDGKLSLRLERAYAKHEENYYNYANNDSELTEDLERTMVNVSISGVENPPKRQKLN